ncbi:MAG: DUF488 domain-containing protein [Flammeovirgaceae bacterium]|jgi:uncharacterized protein (DUF488 family)|nr:DUF488 domain-containing protein [Flammeovirgaceae bacterium]
MFYRRKIILALLQAFDNQLEKIALQKLLFLFTNRQQKPEYEFVPYLYGCYSFSAIADLGAMVRNGNIAEGKNHYESKEKIIYASSLTLQDKEILKEVKHTYSKLSANALMKHTYLNYKYYAINSLKARSILNVEEYSEVVASRPVNETTTLFTIGYEGISLEAYFNKLIKNDVKVLVDVRRNPLSMKFGFSKTLLKKFCENLSINYLHIPEVGIRSEQRQQLNSQADYDKLFNIYKKRNLTETVTQQQQILELLEEKGRIALTCFEANICQCHRKHLAEAITGLAGWKYELKHI